MNFIDIASWQSGLDLSALFKKNKKLGGVIVKVSQGTGFVTPQAKAWLDWLIENGKPTGTYHYLDLAGAEAEARHYVESVKPWLGKVALAIDYEGATVAKGTKYLKACLDEVYRLTGIKPLVYCSQCSCLEAQDFSAIAAAGYPLWVAQYADYKIVDGFLTKPWSRGNPAPFSKYTMRQYTSCGRLESWSKNLDFDLFYGNADDWSKLTQASKPEESTELLKGPDPKIVLDVLMNRYGTGKDREKALRSFGYDPEAIQRKINELYTVAAKVKPLAAGNMDYLNSIVKIVRDV